MVLPNFHYMVVEVPVTQPGQRPDLTTAPRDLLPWADPYIARLISKLDNEAILAEATEIMFDRLEAQGMFRTLGDELEFRLPEEEGEQWREWDEE